MAKSSLKLNADKESYHDSEMEENWFSVLIIYFIYAWDMHMGIFSLKGLVGIITSQITNASLKYCIGRLSYFINS